jgi:hypothetical protein
MLPIRLTFFFVIVDELIHGRELVDNREDVDYLRPGEVDDDDDDDGYYEPAADEKQALGPPPAYDY